VRYPLIVLCHGSVAWPSTPSWVLVLQCRGLSCMAAGPLTGEMPAARAIARQRGRAEPRTPSWVLVLQCRGLSCMAGPLRVLVLQCRGLSCMAAGPLTSGMPAARAMSRQRGWAQHPSWVLVLQCRGLTCMAAGPLTGVTPAACAVSRQRGRAQHPFLGAGATVQGPQLYGCWSPHW
jgi:hypothetical protein